MRPFAAATLALLLGTVAAGAHPGPFAPGLRHLADAARSPTGGAVLGTLPTDEGPCLDSLADARCGEHAALAAHARREVEIARLSAGWDATELRALAVLRGAQKRFADAVAHDEVDRRGADRDDQSQAAAEAQAEAFVALLRRTADTAGRSIAIDTSPRDADATLNATYALVMAEPIGTGTVTRRGVRETQRAWLAYRDAFVALASALDRPTAPLVADLTAARTRDLEGLVAD